MEHRPVGRVPNWELGAWPQTIQRWIEEGMPDDKRLGDWFSGVDAGRTNTLGLDVREFVPVHMGMRPGFEAKVLERSERYEVIQHGNGVVTKALLEGTVGGGRASMDQYLRFPIENMADLEAMKKRYDASDATRYPVNWRDSIPRWRDREHVLILGQNCCTGFYGVARAWMGTENLSYAFHDEPALCEAMFEFIADFVIEVTTPILKEVTFDYFNFFEDLAFKSGPLVGPNAFRRFIFPHYRRAIDHLKRHNVRYISLDSDGNTEPLIPLFLEMGVDIHWPFERAADMDPNRIKRQYGKNLRIWGAVDKREIAKGRRQIDAALRELAPLIESGGFIPTLDHTFPPDISWANFAYYMDRKVDLLEGRF
jgi:uroporphyrinogen decarboxylase